MREYLGDDHCPMRVTAPLAQTVHGMPARQQRVVRAGHGQMCSEEDASDHGQLFHDVPKQWSELDQRIDDVRGISIEAVEHGVLTCCPDLSEPLGSAEDLAS